MAPPATLLSAATMPLGLSGCFYCKRLIFTPYSAYKGAQNRLKLIHSVQLEVRGLKLLRPNAVEGLGDRHGEESYW